MSSVAAVSLISLIGVVTLSLSASQLERLSTALVSVAIGTLIGDAFLHLLPEALESGAPTLWISALTITGFFSFFVLEKLLRHERGPFHRKMESKDEGDPELAVINLTGDALHNFIDGVLIGASYLVSPALGLTTTLAVALHELPQELGDFGVLLRAGMSVRRALLLNLASASVALLGAASTLALGQYLGSHLSSVLVPVTAGGFIYIAAADLVPALKEERSTRGLVTQVAFIALGLSTMAGLTMFER
jgi:zinc and cadmium transporter